MEEKKIESLVGTVEKKPPPKIPKLCLGALSKGEKDSFNLTLDHKDPPPLPSAKSSKKEPTSELHSLRHNLSKEKLKTDRNKAIMRQLIEFIYDISKSLSL